MTIGCEHGDWRCPGCGVTFSSSVAHVHDDVHAFCSEGCAIRHFQDDANVGLKGLWLVRVSE